MRQIVQATGSAAAETPWVPVSDSQNPFNVGLYGMYSQDFSGTGWTFQFSPDDPQTTRQVTITATGTTATVTDVAHELKTGDSIVMTGTNSPLDTTPGAVDITVTDNNTYTYTCGASPPAKAIGKVASMRVFNAPGTPPTTDRSSVLLQSPCRAVRAKLTGWVAGIFNLLVIQAASRTN